MRINAALTGRQKHSDAGAALLAVEVERIVGHTIRCICLERIIRAPHFLGGMPYGTWLRGGPIRALPALVGSGGGDSYRRLGLVKSG